jgi:hypothetical protein
MIPDANGRCSRNALGMQAGTLLPLARAGAESPGNLPMPSSEVESGRRNASPKALQSLPNSVRHGPCTRASRAQPTALSVQLV